MQLLPTLRSLYLSDPESAHLTLEVFLKPAPPPEAHGPAEALSPAWTANRPPSLVGQLQPSLQADVTGRGTGRGASRPEPATEGLSQCSPRAPDPCCHNQPQAELSL